MTGRLGEAEVMALVVTVTFYPHKSLFIRFIFNRNLIAASAAHAGQIYGIFDPYLFAGFDKPQIAAIDWARESRFSFFVRNLIAS